MAVIDSYTTLQTAIADYLARSNLTSFIPNFIQNAENKLYRTLNLRNEETALNVAITDGVAKVPADFKALKHAYYDGSPVTVLDWRTADQLYREFPIRTSSETPCAIARDGSNFIFGENAADGTLKGIYYAKQAFARDQRTNVLLRSENLGATWTITRASDSQQVGTAPNFTISANSLNEDGTAGNTHFASQTFTATDDTDYTFSVYMKASNRTDSQLGLLDGAGNAFTATFDLTNGELTATSNDPAATSITEDVNDWYRCSVSGNVGSGGASEAVQIFVADGTETSFDGLNQQSILVWGAQVETGLVATDYIKTVSATVTTSETDTWYILNAPDVLLYGALLEATPFIRNDPRLPLWQQLFNEAVDTLRLEEREAQRGRQPKAARVA